MITTIKFQASSEPEARTTASQMALEEARRRHAAWGRVVSCVKVRGGGGRQYEATVSLPDPVKHSPKKALPKPPQG